MLIETGYTPTEKLINDIYTINENIKEIKSIQELKDLFNIINNVVEDFKEQELLEMAVEKASHKILDKNIIELE